MEIFLSDDLPIFVGTRIPQSVSASGNNPGK